MWAQLKKKSCEFERELGKGLERKEREGGNDVITLVLNNLKNFQGGEIAVMM